MLWALAEGIVAAVRRPRPLYLVHGTPEAGVEGPCRDDRTSLTTELLGDLGQSAFLSLRLNLLKCKNRSLMNSEDSYKKTSAKGPSQCKSIEIMCLKCSAQCHVHCERSINAGY